MKAFALIAFASGIALASQAMADEFGPAKIDHIHSGNVKQCFFAGGAWFYAPGREADVRAAYVGGKTVEFDFDSKTTVPCHGIAKFAFVVDGDFDY